MLKRISTKAAAKIFSSATHVAGQKLEATNRNLDCTTLVPVTRISPWSQDARSRLVILPASPLMDCPERTTHAEYADRVILVPDIVTPGTLRTTCPRLTFTQSPIIHILGTGQDCGVTQSLHCAQLEMSVTPLDPSRHGRGIIIFDLSLHRS